MKKKIAVLLATWFGSGLIPPVLFRGMGGTYGSLASIPLCFAAVAVGRAGVWFVAAGQDFIYAFVAIAILLAGYWAIPPTEAWLGPRADWRGKVRTHDHN